MKLWIICIAIALLVAPKAFAGDDDPTRASSSAGAEITDQQADGNDDREAIIALLSHYHEMPDRQQLERGSDDAREIVFDLARDEDTFLFHRQRALRALAHWADEEVYEFLVELLDDEDTEDGLRHHLLPVLADGFGEDALDELTPFLFDDDDPQIRISAASAIASIPGEKAHKKLITALEREEHPVVASRIESFATRLR